jgi:uncharacterized phage protein (TIGR02218 family)
MRDLSLPMQARLRGAVQTLAHVWRVTRSDGAMFGFTDHDREIVFAGLACTPASGWRKGGGEWGRDIAVDADLIEAGLSDGAITAADIDAGVWDDALVETFLIDWAAPQYWVKLSAARFGEINRSGAAFHVELRSGKARLNAPIGRVFSRSCDADLGDGRCSVDLSGASYRGSGQIAAVVSPVRFTVSGFDGFEANWFTDGRARINAGRWWEIAAHDVSGAAVTIELFNSPGVALAPGAAVELIAGCNKSFAMCRAKFSNGANFRGFAHMPGNDFLTVVPAPGQGHDGGQRQAG